MREQAGLSKRGLAKLADVDPRNLLSWEQGAHIPTVPSLMRLIPHIGGTIEYYLGYSDEPA